MSLHRVADPRRVLERFLSLTGANPRGPSMAGLLDASPPMEEIAQRFTLAGIPARALRVAAVDLPFVPFPALVGIRGGGHALLRAARRGAATVEFSPGVPEVLSEAKALSVLDGTALVVAPNPSRRSGGALSHWIEIVRASPRTLASLRQLVLLSVLLFLFGVTGPLITRVLVDAALPNVERLTLRLVVVITVVVALHRAIASWLRDRAALFVDLHAEGELLRLLFERLINKPLSSQTGTSAGELQQVLSSGEVFSSELTKGLMLPLVDACLAVGYLAVLAWLAPAFAVAALVSTVTYLGVASVLSSRVRHRQRIEVSTLAAERTALLEVMGGLPTLRAAAAEGFVVRSWRRSLSAHQLASVRRADAESLTNHTLEFIERVTVGGLLIGGAWMCLHGQTSIGELLGAMGALGAYAASLRHVADAMVRWSMLSGHRDRLEDALLAPVQAVASSQLPSKARALGFRVSGNEETDPSSDAIVIDRIWFRHGKDAPWLMQEFSMRIPRGAVMELRWPSGRGKTTLLRMLAGLLTPERGVISIEGRDPAHARGQVLYLPQRAHLFSGSVIDNLRLLSGGASQERIARAAATTGLADIVVSWPMGVETLVASGGANLSSGQRQLILLTAAIASDRPILLLDESLANVDRIQRAMIHERNMFAGRTVVSVVHDGVRDTRSG